MACMRLSRARFGLLKGSRILHRSAASLSACCVAPERYLSSGRDRSFSSGARASDSAIKTQSGAMDSNFVFDGSPESAAMARYLLEEAKQDGAEGIEGIDVRREVHTVYSGRDRWRDINKPKAMNRKSYFAMTEPAMMAHQKVAEPLSLDEAGWTPQTKRTALIGLKCGMLPEWDPWGRRMALTVIKLERCQVVQVKRAEEHAQGKNMLQIGGGFLKAKRANKPHLGQFEKRGLEPNYRLAEFEVSEDGLLPEGTELTARHFVPGQRVDVVGWSKGKGFAGVMKRWNFAGQPASHGNSKAHRKPGSIGNSTTPGKVWKGKKMAGRLGNERTTTQGLRVYKVDEWRDLIYVQGAIPGPAGSFVFVRDSNKRKPTEALPLPTPTFGGMPGTEGYESEMAALQERREVLDAMDGFSPMAARALRDRGMLPDGAPMDPPAFELIAPYDSVDPLTKEIL